MSSDANTTRARELFVTKEPVKGAILTCAASNGRCEWATSLSPIIPGGQPLSVEDEGVVVKAETTTMNFVGTGITATSSGANSVDISVSAADVESGTYSPVASGTWVGLFKQSSAHWLRIGNQFTVGGTILFNGDVTGGVDTMYIPLPAAAGTTDFATLYDAGGAFVTSASLATQICTLYADTTVVSQPRIVISVTPTSTSTDSYVTFQFTATIP